MDQYGHLVRGVVDVDKATAKRLGLDWVGGEARTNVEKARRLAKKYDAFKVVEYASAVPWVFEKTRL